MSLIDRIRGFSPLLLALSLLIVLAAFASPAMAHHHGRQAFRSKQFFYAVPVAVPQDLVVREYLVAPERLEDCHVPQRLVQEKVIVEKQVVEKQKLRKQRIDRGREVEKVRTKRVSR